MQLQDFRQYLNQRATKVTLTNHEISRYSRHLLLDEVGLQGQARIRAARVLMIGAGGLGSPALSYLVAAGVGTIGIVEFDEVDVSNLQRQILYTEADVGHRKLQSVVARLQAQNSGVTFLEFKEKCTEENVDRLIRDFDIVLDGSDNFATRYAVGDACVRADRPYIYGSIFRFEGQAGVFHAKEGPCYRCLFPEPPSADSVPNCAEAGVLGVLPGMIGVLQATEALKLIIGIGEPLLGRLLIYDALAMRFDVYKLVKNPECQACGVGAAKPSARRASVVTPEPAVVPVITCAQFHKEQGERTIIDVRTSAEVAICRLEGCINIPVAELAGRLNELNKDHRYLVYCKSGARSARAVELMVANGFKDIVSLEGGILAWIEQFAPDLPGY